MSNFGCEMSRFSRPWLPAPCPKFRRLSRASKDSGIFTVSCMRQLCIIIVIVFFQRSQWLAWLPISPGSPALLSWKSTKIHLRHHNTIVIRLPLDTSQNSQKAGSIQARNELYYYTRDLPGVALVITFFHDTFQSSQKNLISDCSCRFTNFDPRT